MQPIIVCRLFDFAYSGDACFNPNEIGNMEPTLSFNTIISFMTNTNLQHYTGESGLSYFSQMAVITFMMFTSAATGFAVAMAFIRGLAGKTKTFIIFMLILRE